MSKEHTFIYSSSETESTMWELNKTVGKKRNVSALYFKSSGGKETSLYY